MFLSVRGCVFCCFFLLFVVSSDLSMGGLMLWVLVSLLVLDVGFLLATFR